MSSDITQVLHKALATLNLPFLVSFEEIKGRYRQLSKEHHPDFNQEDSSMREINDAYAVLKQYIFNYRFSFSDQEIEKQFPNESHANKFRI